MSLLKHDYEKQNLKECYNLKQDVRHVNDYNNYNNLHRESEGKIYKDMNDYCNRTTNGEYNYYKSLDPYKCDYGFGKYYSFSGRKLEPCYACCNTDSPTNLGKAEEEAKRIAEEEEAARAAEEEEAARAEAKRIAEEEEAARAAAEEEAARAAAEEEAARAEAKRIAVGTHRERVSARAKRLLATYSGGADSAKAINTSTVAGQAAAAEEATAGQATTEEEATAGQAAAAEEATAGQATTEEEATAGQATTEENVGYNLYVIMWLSFFIITIVVLSYGSQDDPPPAQVMIDRDIFQESALQLRTLLNIPTVGGMEKLAHLFMFIYFVTISTTIN